MFNGLLQRFSTDIGIDLGTANTLVYVRDAGIVVNEPSVVAINRKMGSVVAVGTEAQKMYGRTPQHIEAIRPLVDGVISDYEVTEEMLRFLIRKAQLAVGKNYFLGPRVLVGVPSGITNVESRAVIDATKSAGAREVFLIEEPMAAAVGIGLPVTESVGTMVMDIGGGTTDIAVISLSGVVASKNIKVAGDKFDADIVHYVRDVYQVLIGEKTAEYAKVALAAAMQIDDGFEIPVRGRDLATGLPKQLMLTRNDIARAISDSVSVLIFGVKEVLENAPPEIVSDVMRTGLFLTGGGALIKMLDARITYETGMLCVVGEDPLTAVARGTGIVLENIDEYREIIVSDKTYADVLFTTK